MDRLRPDLSDEELYALRFHPDRTVQDLDEWQLEIYRTMFHRELGVVAALHYCAEHKLNAPAWLIFAATELQCSLLRRDKSKKKGRAAGLVARYRQDMIDYARWDHVKMVREKQVAIREEIKKLRARPGIPPHILKEREKMLVRVGHDWLRAYECAAMILSGSEAHGGPDAMKASYLRVKRNSQNRSLRYHVLDLQLHRKLGLKHELDWPQGRKHVPLYDLTL